MSVPLYLVETLRALERKAQNVLPPRTLMQRAGFAAARLIVERAPSRNSRILILAGPGNNGGDGFEAAVHLKLAGYPVHIVFCGTAETLPDDALGALHQWYALEGTYSSNWLDSAEPGNWDIIVDALFGVGLSRPITGIAAEWIARANRENGLRIAIDIPSGLSADTGAVIGGQQGAVFQADETVTFIAGKPGLYTAHGVDIVGRITLDTLQVAQNEIPPDGYLNSLEYFLSYLPRRKRHSHKGNFGNFLVIGGNQSMLGAVLLSGRAGLHIGAGRVYVVPLDENALGVDVMQPELMFRCVSHIEDIQASSIVIGPGLGLDSLAMQSLSKALEKRCPTLIDADGLNLLAAHEDLSMQAKQSDLPLILTPHPLEAARLLNTSTEQVQSDRIHSALTLARDYKAVVVLKGAGSIIARPDGQWVINPTGCPALASAGTGDVLSGLIGGLLAQGVPTWEAALAGVWIHGCAADHLATALKGFIGVTASEISIAARAELNKLILDESGE